MLLLPSGALFSPSDSPSCSHMVSWVWWNFTSSHTQKDPKAVQIPMETLAGWLPARGLSICVWWACTMCSLVWEGVSAPRSLLVCVREQNNEACSSLRTSQNRYCHGVLPLASFHLLSLLIYFFLGYVVKHLSPCLKRSRETQELAGGKGRAKTPRDPLKPCLVPLWLHLGSNHLGEARWDPSRWVNGWNFSQVTSHMGWQYERVQVRGSVWDAREEHFGWDI